MSNLWPCHEVEATHFPLLTLQELVPHPLNDPNSFGSLADLHGIR